MTMPMDLQHASESFERFLADARDFAGFATRNQTYTMVDGVLRTFRRRLTLKQAIRFAGALPPVLRAMFVADWDTDASPVLFGDRSMMTREVQSLRVHHNFAPDTCISDVARALRRNVEEAAFERALAELPPEAARFWDPEAPRTAHARL